MKLSEIRCLKQITEEDYIDVLRGVSDGETDINTRHYRVIHKDVIDEVMTKEMATDTYLLGHFHPWFIHYCTGLDESLIEAAQKAGAYEEIGASILRREGAVAAMQKEYMKTDSYGAHFSPHDGEEQSVGPYFVFSV